jgi:ATP-dependent Zn protease
MYRSKTYSERTWDEIKMEIDITSESYPDTKRIFLADGDAINLSAERLVQILEYAYKKISCIGKSILLCDAYEFTSEN